MLSYLCWNWHLSSCVLCRIRSTSLLVRNVFFWAKRVNLQYFWRLYHEKKISQGFYRKYPLAILLCKRSKSERLKNFWVTGLVLEKKYNSDEVWLTLSRSVNSQNNGCGYYKSTCVVYEVFSTWFKVQWVSESHRAHVFQRNKFWSLR